MMFKFSKRALVAALGVAASTLLPSSAAIAREKVIDGIPLLPFTPCTIGASCAPTSIGFSVDFGNGPFSELYIYGNGLISFGAEIGAGADLSSLTTIGVNVFTAGYSPTMTLGEFVIGSGPSNDPVFAQNIPVLRIGYRYALPGQPDPALWSPIQVDLYRLGAGDFVLQYDYGGSGIAADIANDAYIGYNFLGGGSVQVNAPQAAVRGAGANDFRYFLPGGAPAVPEPATWISMIAGFGLAGARLRKRRSAVAVKA
jgi:hypothetical protein